MHNKLFIADNVLGVTGGRNLGDAYFGNARANFIDLDVLAAGPLVQDLSRSFDAYWNNERAYPVQSLVSRKELDQMRDSARTADAAQGPARRTANGEQRPQGEAQTPEQRAHAWDQKAMDLSTAYFVWAPAVVLVDQPAKIPADGSPEAGSGKAPGPWCRARTAGRPAAAATSLAPPPTRQQAAIRWSKACCSPSARPAATC